MPIIIPIISQRKPDPSPPMPPDCKFQVKLSSQVFQCMTANEYQMYSEDQHRIIQENNQKTTEILAGIAIFILFALVVSIIFFAAHKSLKNTYDR